MSCVLIYVFALMVFGPRAWCCCLCGIFSYGYDGCPLCLSLTAAFFFFVLFYPPNAFLSFYLFFFFFKLRLHTSIAMSVMTATLNDTIAYCFWESGRLVFSNTYSFFLSLEIDFFGNGVG